METLVRGSFHEIDTENHALTWRNFINIGIVIKDIAHFYIIVVDNELSLFSASIHPLALCPSGDARLLTVHVMTGCETYTVSLPFQLTEDLNGFMTRLHEGFNQLEIFPSWCRVVTAAGRITD
jgi:hypothetical protein